MNSDGEVYSTPEGEVYFTPEGGEEQFLGYMDPKTDPFKIEEDEDSFDLKKFQESINQIMGMTEEGSSEPVVSKSNALVAESQLTAGLRAQQLADEFCKLVPSLMYQFAEDCPYSEQCSEYVTSWCPLKEMIIHLNDGHGMTREQIADWLESLAPEVDINVYEKDSERVRWVETVNRTAYQDIKIHQALGISLNHSECHFHDSRPVWDRVLHRHLQRYHGWGVQQLNKAAKNIYERDF